MTLSRTERPLVLIGGGARSGKSAFAIARAVAIPGPRVFVATAQPFDDEMRRRIEAHQEERSGRFRTVEAFLDLPQVLERLGRLAGEERPTVVVVDCLTLWLSNLLLTGASERDLGRDVDALAATLAKRAFTTLVVTNEVGMGVVPETRLGRDFRDLAGRAHQRLARDADEIYAGLLGVLVRVRPGPMEAVVP